MKRFLMSFAVVSLLVIPGSLLAEQTLTFQDGDGGSYSNTQGTFLDTFNKTGSGTDEALWAAGDVIDTYALALVRFPDIFGANPGQIPPGSEIESATLQLTRYFATPHASSVWVVTGSWDEDTSTGNSIPTLAGNVGTIPDGGSATTYVLDVTTAVQAWSSGSAANWGLEILHVINGVGIAQNSFYSDDAATLANRPLLSVTFSSSTATEVTTWGRVKALYR